MSEPGRFVAEGVIPATLVAFHDDFSIDIAASRKHLRDVVNVGGLSAVTVNGHASEIHAFTLGEQQSLLAESLAEAGDELPLVNGVYAMVVMQRSRWRAWPPLKARRPCSYFRRTA